MASYNDAQHLPILNQTSDGYPDDESESRDELMTSSDDQEATTSTNGLSVFTASVFLVGEMAGSGILALPLALESMGYIGLVMFVVMACVCAYTGKLLGTCWLIVQERHVEYKGHVRHPYPVIGQITYGKVGRLIVSFSNNFTMFGGGVVFLILASENIHSLLEDLFGAHLSFCYIQLIVAALLVPLMWLGTPKDFWPVAVGAAVATVVACVVLVSAVIKDNLGPYTDIPLIHTNIELLGFFEALGVVLFAFGGHPIFPTLQTDMKQPRKFSKAISIAYSAISLMYIPVALSAYLTYGKDVKDNILETISPGPLLYVVQILITCHLFCAFIIVLSPVVQEIEELFKIPKEFSWRRMVSRTVTLLCALFVALTIPKFGSLLALVGGSSMVILSCICPPLFYLKLRTMEGDWPKIRVPLHIKVLLIEIMVVSAVVGVFSTYGSIRDLTAPGSFTLPCYVDMSKAHG